MQLGAAVTPRRSACPWMPVSKASNSRVWQRPQVCGTFVRKMDDVGSFARFRSWLSWQSLQVAARGFCECPCTLFV